MDRQATKKRESSPSIFEQLFCNIRCCLIMTAAALVITLVIIVILPIPVYVAWAIFVAKNIKDAKDNRSRCVTLKEEMRINNKLMKATINYIISVASAVAFLSLLVFLIYIAKINLANKVEKFAGISIGKLENYLGIALVCSFVLCFWTMLVAHLTIINISANSSERNSSRSDKREEEKPSNHNDQYQQEAENSQPKQIDDNPKLCDPLLNEPSFIQYNNEFLHN